MTTREAVLATLAYHDIFDYPLTADQIYNFLPKKISRNSFKRELANFGQSKLYSLPKRRKLITINYQRNKISKKKLKLAQQYAKTLSFIPTIKMVALTGALAMGNCTQQDDIDLLVVTGKNQLWTTRLLANLVLFPHKRKPGEGSAANKACLNIFLAENSLKIGTQNLYTAHEVAQTKPLWQRENTYYEYIKANSWVKKYLSNWEPYLQDSLQTYPQLPFTPKSSVLEKIAKEMQLIYMKKKVTSEKIGDNQLFFHPSDTERWVLSKYQKKLREILR